MSAGIFARNPAGKRIRPVACSLALLLAPLAAANAEAPAPNTPPAAATTGKAPQLLVVISVDQFSADLFGQYRTSFSKGLHRLTQGVVFPKGYQSHAATETCPGHSTILTGMRPGHTGIIANYWVDQTIDRAGSAIVYCSEDPKAPGSSARKNTVQAFTYLRAKTLGDRLKAHDPESRVISVSGKDRAAMMLGGPGADQIWWWKGKGFATLAGRPASTEADGAGSTAKGLLAQDHAAMPLPPQCAAVDHAVTIPGGPTVGTGRFARKADQDGAFRASPELDAAVLDLAGRFIDGQSLGRRGHTDLLAIGLSATDYVGHTYGTEGAEMCIQLDALDAGLGTLFDKLDATGVDYLVVLTADHGGHDTPERSRENAAPDALRARQSLTVPALNAYLAKAAGVANAILAESDDASAIASGDLYLNKAVPKRSRAKVLAMAEDYLRNRTEGQVAEVFTHDRIAAAPSPSGPPESWSLLDEVKANFAADRSGDLVVLLKPRVTPILDPGKGYIATHGSPWDYDRRVPILFWRKGLAPFEQPLGVETVDIAPTLASLIGLPLDGPPVDGKCLDLLVGPADSCAPPAR